MKRFKMPLTAGAVLIFGLLALGFVPRVVLGAIPQLINAQGVLRDGSGNPVPNAFYSTTFRIYDAASGGSVLWSEAQSVATLGGQFNVNLGSVTPIPDSVFNSSNRWLGIQVSPDAEMTPRSRLVSVGNAYRVSSVEGATGGNIYGDINLHSTLTVGDFAGEVGRLAITDGTSNTIIADGASGDLSLSAAGRILKGGFPFIHTPDFNNSFIGSDAGGLTISGSTSNNTGIGLRALRSNAGNANTAGGAFALENNTTGFNNTGLGTSAMRNNVDGINNTAIGYAALFSNTNRDSITAVGAFALRSNTSGFRNTGLGANSLRSNTVGAQNTATGFGALNLNTSGDLNTATGVFALASNSTADGNTAHGAYALAANTTGFNTTASGNEALRQNVDGVSNTAIGYRALFGNTIDDGNTACGAYALENAIGSANTATGVEALRNTTGNSNTANGYFALQNNTSGGSNTAVGESALRFNTTGGFNTAVGLSALLTNTTGSANTAIGLLADVSAGNLTNATAIGFQALVNASNKIRLGNASVTVLECQVGLTVVSDRNQKENFRTVDGEEVLRKIRGFNPTSWNYKGHDPKQFRHYGPMAQDFFAVFGDDGVGKIGTETTINSGDMAGILMIAVQALGNENADLKTRIEYLEEKLKEMQAEKPQVKVY